MNVLLVTTDQHKATTIGAYGDPLGATPALDRLGAAGTRFARCRTQNPFCQPARATILTGTYPSTHGVVRNGMDLPLAAECDSIASRLSHGEEVGRASLVTRRIIRPISTSGVSMCLSSAVVKGLCRPSPSSATEPGSVA